MKTKIIPIGNSKGVRIPKALLEESGLVRDVELKVKKGEIRIIAPAPQAKTVADTVILSESALMKDWGRPEEDEAWADL